MNEKEKCADLGFGVFLFVGACFAPIRANAYVLNGYVFDEPRDINVGVSTMASQYYALFMNGLEAWEGISTEIAVSNTPGNDIYFYSETSVDNGTYAVCRHFSNNTHTITVYSSFTDLSATLRNETIVHEIGHAFGLAHCQESKNSISVMRALGFNNKPYPLADDIQGIEALYG